MNFNWPLINDNISKTDREVLADFCLNGRYSQARDNRWPCASAFCICKRGSTSKLNKRERESQ